MTNCAFSEADPLGVRNLVTVHSGSTIIEAARAMSSAGIGCLVIIDAKGALAGVFTERDIAVRVLAPGLDPSKTTVGQVMSSDVVSVRSGTSMEVAEELMSLHHIRHLPVTAAGRVVDMISSRDVIGHQVRTSRAKQAAAEQVAMLSTSLKNLDFNDVVAMIVREVPRIFSAGRALASLERIDRKGTAAKKTTVIKSHHCLCPEAELGARRDVQQAVKSDHVRMGAPPPACRRCKAGKTMVLIPVNLAMFAEGGQRTPSCNYICMCDLSDADLDADVLNYKASLAREVLSYNLSHARMWQEAKTLVMIDSLTGAGTRRVLDNALEAETLRATRYHRPYCIGMIDVDRFKSINDSMGHQVGDRALAEVGRCLQSDKRVTDTLVRYGGDEFVMLLPETTLGDAVRVMERMRLKVKSLSAAKDFPVTISCGIAEFVPTDNMTPNELVRRADMALFRAKKLGRDRIETWESVSASGICGPMKVRMPQIQTLQNHVAALSARSKDFFIQSVHGLVQALEARDPYTKSHSDNVLHYGVAIARTMGLSDLEIDTVRVAAMIHDIGKLGVPDSILLKPNRLTPAERRVMEEHPLIAVRILDTMRFLERELPAVRGHHERWDGAGYPDHLAATRIPLEARILAAADAFDAMTSTRVYHQSRTVAQAQAILQECSGTQFDPGVAAALINWIRQMRRKLKPHGELTARDLLETREASTFAA